MRSSILAAILLAGVAALPSASARAAVSADINLHIGERYPVYFRQAPRMYVVPRTDVYYTYDDSYDMFRYGNRWYLNDGGEWFCARTYRGPFVRVAFQSVPRVILQVPARYHRQSRGYWQDNRSWQSSNWRDRDWNNDSWRGHDQGRNGRGHGNNGRGHGNGRGNRHGHGDGDGRGDYRDDND